MISAKRAFGDLKKSDYLFYLTSIYFLFGELMFLACWLSSAPSWGGSSKPRCGRRWRCWCRAGMRGSPWTCNCLANKNSIEIGFPIRINYKTILFMFEQRLCYEFFKANQSYLQVMQFRIKVMFSKLDFPYNTCLANKKQFYSRLNNGRFFSKS